MASFVKDVFSVGLSKGIVIISGLITSIIIARVLGPEKNGTIAALLVYPSLFMSFGSLGIRQSTTFFLGQDIFPENQIKTSISQIWLFSTFISIVACFLLMFYFSDLGEDLGLILLALAPIPFTLFNTYNSGIFLGKNEIAVFNRINWIPSVIMLMLTIVCVLWLSMDIKGYLIAMTGGPIFIFVVLLFKNKLIKAFNLTVDWTVVRKMLGLGLIYAFSLLIINLNYKVDIILLDKLSTAYEVGIYSKGSGITQYLWQIPMLFGTIVFARSSISKDGNAFSLRVAQLLRLSFIVIGFGALVLILFSDLIIIGMFGEAFRGSISVLKILLPGVILLTIYKVMNMDLAGKGKPWISLKAMLPALIINIILNIWLIPEFGADGAAFSSTVSYTMAAVLFFHFYSTEVNIPIKNIVAFKKTDFKPFFQFVTKLK